MCSNFFFELLGSNRPSLPRPDLNLGLSMSSEKRKIMDLQLGGPSGDSGAAFMPFSSKLPEHSNSGCRQRIQSRTIRDVLPENTRLLYFP